MTMRRISHGIERKYISKFKEIEQIRNFITSFISTVSSVSYKFKHLFLMFGVARSILFEKIFKTVLQNLQYDVNNLGTRLLSTCYSNYCWIPFQDK